MPTSSRLPSLLWPIVIISLLSSIGASALTAQDGPLGPSGGLVVTTAPSVEDRVQNTGPHTAVFTVTNQGTTTLYGITLLCHSTGPVTCGTVTPDTWGSVAPWASFQVSVQFSVGAMGTGMVQLEAAPDIGDPAFGQRTINVIYGPAPTVSLAPYNFDHQVMGRCAQSCFAATFVKSTVPYFSLDAPRSVTLVYHGDRVAPKPFIHVDVTHPAGYSQTPTKFWLEAKVNGVLVTFVNGETRLKFTASASQTVRLGGQFDANSYTTGVYPLDIIVTSEYSGGVAVTAISTKLTVVNETTSPIARGWTLAGIQRLYFPTGGVLVTEGDGSAVYFTAPGGGVYTSPAGEFSQLVNGVPGGGSGYTRLYPDSTKVVFNTSGRMTEIRDRFNNTTTIVYDASNRVSQIKDPLNLAYILTYNGNGLYSIKDPGNRYTYVTVHPSNKRLTALQDPDGVSTTFGYDGSVRLSTITDRRSKTTTLGYDAQSGKLATVTAPAVLIYGQGTVSPVASFAAWHKLGVPYGATSSTPATPPRADTVRATVTEPGGAVTRFTVDRWGQPVVATHPLGGQTTVTYSSAGLPIRVVRPGYGVDDADSAVYNAGGQATYLRPAGRTPTNVRYGAWGQVDSVWGTGQRALRYLIGANGRVDSVRVDGQFAGRYRYETRGRPDSVFDGKRQFSGKYVYGGTNGNLSQVILPGGRIWNASYDSHGRQATDSAPGRPKQTTYYSVINRVDSTVVGTSPTTLTKYGYDNLFLTSVTDPKNQVYGFAYNDLGWLTRRTDPAGKFDSLYYNRDGDVVRTTDRRGSTQGHSYDLTFSYDSLHRLTSRTGDGYVTWPVTWTYGNHGRVATGSMGWPGSYYNVETLYLNVRGQPDSAKTDMAGQTYWRRYFYSAAGLLDSTRVSGGGITWTKRDYVYNASKGVLTGIRLDNQLTEFTLDANFQPTGISLPGGDGKNFTFGTLHAPYAMTTAASYSYSGVVERFMGLDGEGRVDRHLVEGGTEGRFFEYDPLARLKIASTRGLGTSLPQGCPDPDYGYTAIQCLGIGSWTTTAADTFAYDAVGNRTDRGGTYTTGNRVTAFGNCDYTTDFAGQVGQRSGAQCSAGYFWAAWLAEGRSHYMGNASQTLAFLYDALGRLVRKAVGSDTTHFLWDGDNLLAELGSGGTTKRAEYSYYPGLDNLHALIVGSEKYYAHSDGLGNVIALTDTTKSLKRDYAYDEWGKYLGGNDLGQFNNVDRARWKGALWLGPEIDLYYMRNRWYEPHSGRFLSEDPIGLGGGINPVIYGGADPINHADPTGLDWCWVWVGLHKDHYEPPGTEGHGRWVLQACLGSGGSLGGYRGYGGEAFWPGGGPGGLQDGPAGAGGSGPDVGDKAVAECRVAIVQTTLSAVFDIASFGLGRLAASALADASRFAQIGRGISGLGGYADAGRTYFAAARGAAADAAYIRSLSLSSGTVGFASSVALLGVTGSGGLVRDLVGFVPYVGTFADVADALAACSPS